MSDRVGGVMVSGLEAHGPREGGPRFASDSQEGPRHAAASHALDADPAAG
jgi:hypothetical protein